MGGDGDGMATTTTTRMTARWRERQKSHKSERLSYALRSPPRCHTRNLCLYATINQSTNKKIKLYFSENRSIVLKAAVTLTLSLIYIWKRLLILQRTSSRRRWSIRWSLLILGQRVHPHSPDLCIKHYHSPPNFLQSLLCFLS